MRSEKITPLYERLSCDDDQPNAKEEDNLMRVKSKKIAQELLEIGFTVSDR